MTNTLVLVLGPLVFVSVLLMIEIGHRHQRRLLSRGQSSGVAPVATVVLSLMGLVLAFSFSNAATRLDASRKTILDEANAIETAWLRVDVAEPELQPRLRELFRRYVDARIRVYATNGSTYAQYRRDLARSNELLRDIWTIGLEATPTTRMHNRTLLMPAIGAMGDAASARTLSLGTHISPSVFGFLFGLVLLGGMLIGALLADANGGHWSYRLIAATVLSATVFVIVDMEYARLGAFHLLEGADALLIDLRRSMG